MKFKCLGFYVKQNWEALEQLGVCTCYEQGNSYEIYNIPAKQFRGKGMEGDVKIMRAEEKTGCCTRFLCGENRRFNFNFKTPQSDETFVRMSRRYRCCGWAVFPCCAHKVNIHSAVQVNEENKLEIVGTSDKLNFAGSVAVPWFHGGCCVPYFNIYNENKQKTGHIWGYSCCCMPCIICDFCGAEFGIYKDGVQVGELKKRGVHSCKDYLYEMNTEADKFTVEFTEEALKEGAIDTNFKLAVLAAVIQIDFNYFEDKRGIREGRCCDIVCCGYACPCMPALLLGCLSFMCGLICCCCKDDDDKKKKKKKKDTLLE